MTLVIWFWRCHTKHLGNSLLVKSMASLLTVNTIIRRSTKCRITEEVDPFMVSCEFKIREYKLRLVSRLGDYMCICIYLTAVNKLKYTVKQVAQEGKDCSHEEKLAEGMNIQSTLVISNSLISNNCLSRSENLVPVLTQKSTDRQQNIVEKRREQFLFFSTIFSIYL